MSSMFYASDPAAYLQNAEYLYFADATSSPYGCCVDYETYIGVCDYINELTKNLNELGAKHYTTCGKLATLRAEKEALRAENESLRAEKEALRAENAALRADLKVKTSWHYLATMGEEAPVAPAPVAVEASAAPAPAVVEASAPAPVVVVAPAPAPVVKPTTDRKFIVQEVLDFMAGKVNTIEPSTTVSSTTPKPPNKKGKKGNAAFAAEVPEVPEVPEVSAAQMAAAQAYFTREYADTAAGLGFGESSVKEAQHLLLEAERLKKEERLKEAKANYDANLRTLEKAKADAEEAEAKKTAAASVVTPVETALPEVNRYASIIADVLAKYANGGACATAPVSETSSNRGCEFESMDAYNTFIDSELSNPLKTRRCGHGIHEKMETCRFRHVCTIFKKVGNKSVCACILKNRCIFGHRICSSIKKANCSAPDCPDWHTDDQTRVTIKGM